MRYLPLLLLAGCLEYDEEITIRPDGSADVRLMFRGEPGDFATVHLPSWSTSKKVETEEGREKWTVTATKTFRDLNDYPAKFAEKARFGWTTRLKVSTRGGVRVYEFEREYPRMDAAAIDAIDEAMLKDPKVTALIERIGEKGVPGLSREDRLLLFELLVRNERDKRMIMATRAVGEYARQRGTPAEEQLEILQRMESAYRDVKPDRYLADVEKDPYGEEYLRELRKKSIEAVPGIASLYEVVETEALEGKALADDSIKLSVRLPGEVIAGNGTVQDGRVRWEFDGKELFKGPKVLRAVSIQK